MKDCRKIKMGAFLFSIFLLFSLLSTICQAQADESCAALFKRYSNTYDCINYLEDCKKYPGNESSCAGVYAAAKNDPSICKNVPVAQRDGYANFEKKDWVDHDDCIKKYAVEKKNPDICLHYRNRMFDSKCYLEVAR